VHPSALRLVAPVLPEPAQAPEHARHRTHPTQVPRS
jgi:hypothetical protein